MSVVAALVVVAAVVVLVHVVDHVGRDPRRGGDPGRRNPTARFARGWVAVVDAREAALLRASSFPEQPFPAPSAASAVAPASPRVRDAGPPSATSRSAPAGGS